MADFSDFLVNFNRGLQIGHQIRAQRDFAQRQQVEDEWRRRMFEDQQGQRQDANDRFMFEQALRNPEAVAPEAFAPQAPPQLFDPETPEAPAQDVIREFGRYGPVNFSAAARRAQAQREADAGIRQIAQHQAPGQRAGVVYLDEQVLAVTRYLDPLLEQQVGERAHVGPEDLLEHEALGRQARALDEIDEERVTLSRAGDEREEGNQLVPARLGERARQPAQQPAEAAPGLRRARGLGEPIETEALALG